MMINKLKIPLTIIMAAISLLLLIILVWALSFFAYYTAFLVFLGILVFLPLKITYRRIFLLRASIFLIGLILLITTIHYPIGEINKRIRLLDEKPRDKSSLSSFTTRDKVGIYGLNLMMGIFAYPIYPEVSKETLLMIFPCKKNGTRTFYSDFAIGSEKVQAVLNDFIADLSNSQQNEEDFIVKKRVSWSTRDYSLEKEEARYALALNPSDVLLKATKKGSKWLIDISLQVKCSYPQQGSATLISKPELKVEEGLFWVLQQEGWLFPYTAEWKFSTNSDELPMLIQ